MGKKSWWEELLDNFSSPWYMPSNNKKKRLELKRRFQMKYGEQNTDLQTKLIRCSNCGLTLFPHEDNCICGTPRPTYSEEIEKKMKICNKCKKEVSDDQKYCKNCGEKII